MGSTKSQPALTCEVRTFESQRTSVQPDKQTIPIFKPQNLCRRQSKVYPPSFSEYLILFEMERDGLVRIIDELKIMSDVLQMMKDLQNQTMQKPARTILLLKDTPFSRELILFRSRLKASHEETLQLLKKEFLIILMKLNEKLVHVVVDCNELIKKQTNPSKAIVSNYILIIVITLVLRFNDSNPNNTVELEEILIKLDQVSI